MIARALAETAVRDAIAACNPATLVAQAVATMTSEEPARGRVGIAVGKAALAMARGAGSVTRGIVVAPHAGDVPPGWRVMVGSHPEPDERSGAAGRALAELVDSATDREQVIALISGGASSLVELPRIPLDGFRITLRALMAAGVPIADLNIVRGALSKIKAGQLALRSSAPIITLAVSDVIGDDLSVIGSGLTIGPWLATPGTTVNAGAERESRRCKARAILVRTGIAIPAELERPIASEIVARDDRAIVLAPMASFARAAAQALRARGIEVNLVSEPLATDVTSVAHQLAAYAEPIVAFGEPTIWIPEHSGQGGRAQQLALELALHLRGTERSALVIGSDGIDGPAPRERPAPAGAFVDGTTWSAIEAQGLDPNAALERCDAGTVLAAVGALVVTGPTGINHADLVVLG